MQDDIISMLRGLKYNLEEIAPFLDTAQMETYGEKKQDGLDLLTGELTMIVLMLTNADNNLSPNELMLINEIRHVVYGYGISDLDSNDYFELCKKFLRIYPEKRMTIDHLPISIRLLIEYDKKYDTKYSIKARNLFLSFSEALIKIDENENHIEQILFLNFKDLITNATA